MFPCGFLDLHFPYDLENRLLLRARNLALALYIIYAAREVLIVRSYVMLNYYIIYDSINTVKHRPTAMANSLTISYTPYRETEKPLLLIILRNVRNFSLLRYSIYRDGMNKPV